MKKTVFYLLLLITFFGFSAEINEKTYPIPDFITLKGVSPEYTYSFYIDNYWDIKESSLNLRIAQSQIKNYKNSTLTVFLNNIPVNTIEIGNVKNGSDMVLNIDSNVMKKGFNNLKIKIFHKINPGSCVLDDIDAGNWVVIDKSTALKIRYENIQNTSGLQSYPLTYVRGNGSVDTVIALPEKADNDEIAAALTMALFLGRKAPFYNTPVKIIKYSEISNIDSNVILIGKTDKIDKNLAGLTPEEIKAVESSKGLIKEIGIKDKKLLLVTGKGRDGLKNSVKVLTDENLYFQLKPVSNIIENIELPEHEKVSMTTFKDFSYENIVLSGSNDKVASYNFALDRNTEYDNVKIKVNFKNSDNLDYSASEVTAFVNDVPIASKKLEKQFSSGNSMEFAVPSNLIIKGNINLKIRFFLTPDRNECSSADSENPWVFISNDSSVDLKYNERKIYRLGTYPGPFIKDYRLNNTGFVIPENMDFDELNYLVNIAFYLGKNTRITDYAEVYNDITEDKNLIVYGLSEEKYIKKLNSRLYLKYDTTFKKFEKNEKVSFINNDNKIGALETIKEKDNRIIVVTAPRKSEAMLALSYLTGNFPNLRGDVMLVDETGQTKSFYYLNNKNDLSDQRPEIDYNLVALGIVAVFSFLLSIILIFMQKKGEKK